MKTKHPARPTPLRLQFVVIGCVIRLASSTTHAAQALEFQGGLTETIPGNEVGWSFHVLTPIAIDSFGWFDAGSNGLVESHTVHLWSGIGVTGTLVASGVVLSTDPLSAAGYRFAQINPVTLDVGDYIISGNAGNDAFQDFGSGVTTMPEIAYLTGRYAQFPGDSSEFPARFADRGFSYVGPNFTATPAVPEPSSLAFILGGTAVSALRHRRRRNG